LSVGVIEVVGVLLSSGESASLSHSRLAFFVVDNAIEPLTCCQLKQAMLHGCQATLYYAYGISLLVPTLLHS
jgi:hypothetical protein